ncbi:MAG: DUF3800 domain-containing protein [Deltaproteobacteria bacterium]|nr:DUF3800 domain-containing protein [Deltaproteobacteria bacterium]MBW1966277.1 DUF3800 domain-containing protein [Deltaproteobacteria bacterium]MBW2098071.1 DUF3800 domain-containing protein [Deltaproteobacteria bacterium]
MRFEVYCDESMPDLFTTKKPAGCYLMIGSLWLPGSLRARIKDDIQDLRKKHNTWGEIKWSKVSPSRLSFYLELLDMFFSYSLELRFRCIAVDRTQINMKFHDNDSELGFYKFYYQLLHHWIFDFNEYRIFCDIKTNRDPERLKVLKRCLQNANLSSTIKDIQSLPSGQVVLIQLCDLLLGAAGSRMNKTLRDGSAKSELVHYLEKKLGVGTLAPTPRGTEKFNIFKIQLNGGW